MTDKTPGPTSTDSPSEAQGGPPVRKVHPYDASGLSAKEFLLAIMHDPSVPLGRRIEVACELLKLWPHPWDYVPPAYTIVIGGLPEGTSVSVSSGQEPRPDAPGPEDHPPLMH